MKRTDIDCCQKNSRSGGFSLIEVAIALIIISLFLIPTLQTYKMYEEEKRMAGSRDNLYVVKSALQKFHSRQSRYPMPSNPTIAKGTVGYGVEVPAATINANPCVPGLTPACVTTSGSRGGVPVYIGDVPFATLGLPERYARDSYGKRFVYAVTASLTNVATFDEAAGAISIVDKTGAQMAGTANDMHFALNSFGANGVGAVTNSGVAPFPCPGTGAESENCDNDAVFNSNYAVENTDEFGNPIYARSEVANDDATHYDDYNLFVNSLEYDIWRTTPINMALVVNTFREIGNTRIGAWNGTGGPANGLPRAKVDVAGSGTAPGIVRATTVYTDRICTYNEEASNDPDLADEGCIEGNGIFLDRKRREFKPEIFGGDVDPTLSYPRQPGYGIFCGSAVGLTGIAFSDELCNDYIVSPERIDVDPNTCGKIGYGGAYFRDGMLYCDVSRI